VKRERKRIGAETVELEPATATQRSAMAKNCWELLPRLTGQELDYITLALADSRADYRALPREQIKQERVQFIGLLSCEDLIDDLLKAESKGLLPVGATHAIACKLKGKPTNANRRRRRSRP
jgi:hypothetical protein